MTIPEEEIKTSWQVREWVEETITESQSDRDIDWSEIHFDRFGKEYDELHERDQEQWISLSYAKKREEKLMKKILEQVTRHKRGTNLKKYLINDLEIIEGELLKELEKIK